MHVGDAGGCHHFFSLSLLLNNIFVVTALRLSLFGFKSVGRGSSLVLFESVSIVLFWTTYLTPAYLLENKVMEYFFSILELERVIYLPNLDFFII